MEGQHRMGAVTGRSARSDSASRLVEPATGLGCPPKLGDAQVGIASVLENSSHPAAAPAAKNSPASFASVNSESLEPRCRLVYIGSNLSPPRLDTAGCTSDTPRAGKQNAPVVVIEKRQIYHTPGLALCHCLRRNSRYGPQNAMIELSAAALAYARQPGFSALVFSDVKTPTESAAYTQAAADDLSQMGLTVLTQTSSSARLLVVARNARRWLSWRKPTTGLIAGFGWL